jgi:hypothetical protein
MTAGEKVPDMDVQWLGRDPFLAWWQEENASAHKQLAEGLDYTTLFPKG